MRRQLVERTLYRLLQVERGCAAPGARARGARGCATGLAGLAALVAVGCGAEAARPSWEETARAVEPLVGRDGDVTVSAEGTVLNRYVALSADVAPGATSILVSDVAALDSPLFGPIQPGDLVMIYQAHGASIDTMDTSAFGAVTALNHAGSYELVSVTGVLDEGLRVDGSCGGLRHAYDVAGRAQVVRVPQFARLTVTGTGSIVPAPWDGAVGGIVALHADETVVLDGRIDASAAGFRGGVEENFSALADTDTPSYARATPDQGAEKGESIAGDRATYAALGVLYGRGAPANGGGGGSAHNGGGGGGANGPSGAVWTGQGIMNGGVVGAAAWALDPAFAANGGLTASSGGGRGGYSFSAANQDALTAAPGSAGWGGNLRRERGGLGGRPLSVDIAHRLFFGGGGGAGDGNNGGGAGGGAGGGLVLVIAGSVSGGGQIVANGETGHTTTAGGNDAAGGGGGGGTIVVRAGALSGVALQANGGRGGNQIIVGPEAEGPGGGGSGGVVAFSGGAVSLSARAGRGGTTNSTSMTEFPSNGATDGAPGQAGVVVSDDPDAMAVCIDVTAPDTTIPTAERSPSRAQRGHFVLASDDARATFECSLDGGVFAACSSAFTTDALEEGVHTLAARAVDPVGNVDPTPATARWVIKGVTSGGGGGGDAAVDCAGDGDCGGSASGRVCGDTRVCVDGCRGESGNGCPDGERCTSTDTLVGECVSVGGDAVGAGGGADGGGAVAGGASDTGADDETDKDDVVLHGNGFLCAASSGANGAGGGWAGLLGVALGALARARRQARGSSSRIRERLEHRTG